jgi:hypothetical protein
VRVFHGSLLPSQPVVVVVDGSACEEWGRAGGGGFASLWRALHALAGWHPTRVDLARDLPGPTICRYVRDAFRGGWYRGRIHPQSCKWIEDDAKGGGRTVYLGSRSSLVYVRCYDRRGPTRWEFEAKSAKAGEVWRRLLTEGTENAWAACVAAFGHWSHEFPWWTRLTDHDPCERLAFPHGASSLSDAMEAFRRQHGPTLARLLACGIGLSELLPETREAVKARLRQTSLWVTEAQGLGYVPPRETLEILDDAIQRQAPGHSHEGGASPVSGSGR